MKAKENKLKEKIAECIYHGWDGLITPTVQVRVIDEIMNAINNYEVMMGHYKISPLMDKPGFYAVDQPDFNVVMAVFKGEKEIAEGEWYLINLKEQEPEVKEYGWNTIDKLPEEPMMCYVEDINGRCEQVYWDGEIWYPSNYSEMKSCYFEKWKPAK